MRHIQPKKWSCCLEEKTTVGSIKIKLFFYGKCANVAFIAVEKRSELGIKVPKMVLNCYIFRKSLVLWAVFQPLKFMGCFEARFEKSDIYKWCGGISSAHNS